MDTKNQFAFFLWSVAIGLIGGLLYELIAFVRHLCRCNRRKRKWLGVGLDIFFGISFAFLSIISSFFLQFPDFRGYMYLGWLLGGIIYLIFLRRIVAFYHKICYNVLVEIVTKAKSKEKTLQKERDLV